jgi:hypothetical protein
MLAHAAHLITQISAELSLPFKLVLEVSTCPNVTFASCEELLCAYYILWSSMTFSPIPPVRGFDLHSDL